MNSEKLFRDRCKHPLEVYDLQASLGQADVSKRMLQGPECSI